MLKLGWRPPEPALRAAAVAAARKADVAVVFANDVTAEGMDRSDLVAARRPGPADRGGREGQPAHRGGPAHRQRGADALARRRRGDRRGLVSGPAERSRRSPRRSSATSTPRAGCRSPSRPAIARAPLANNPARYPGVEQRRRVQRGPWVGYRFYDAKGKRPLFPFGYGLSYTSFSLGHLKVKKRGSGYEASVRVSNTGDRAGAEVVQLYLGFPPSAGEPPRQLKALPQGLPAAPPLGKGEAEARPIELRGLRRGDERLEGRPGHLSDLRRHLVARPALEILPPGPMTNRAPAIAPLGRCG